MSDDLLDTHHYACWIHGGGPCGVKHRTHSAAERHAARIKSRHGGYDLNIYAHAAPGQSTYIESEGLWQDDIEECCCDDYYKEPSP